MQDDFDQTAAPRPDAAPAEDADHLTHFGFQPVRRGEKAGRVRDVFDAVARRYDLMNDVLSVGVHRLWKNNLVDWLNPQPGCALIDVAGGTGDIAARILRRTKGQAAIHVCDINEQMLAAGRRRDQALAAGVNWIAGNAEALPFADASFDAYTIAFGIRNVTDIPQALREARRVLKPGGRFLCLEFSQVDVPILDTLYDFHSFRLMPQLGEWVGQNRAAYQYLVESIRQFPAQDDFAAMIGDAGLGQVKYRNQSGGIAALHSAWRI